MVQPMTKMNDAYKEYVIKTRGADVWHWRSEALPRDHNKIFNAGWLACQKATSKAEPWEDRSGGQFTQEEIRRSTERGSDGW
jgi:hypothetical protein